MIYLPVFSYLLILFCITNGSSYRFDYEYSKTVGGWLKYHQMPATWNDARLICHAEGAVLLSPTDRHIKSKIIKIMIFQHISRGIFTGIHASFAKGVFASLQGVPFSKIPLNWAPNEPDNYENSEDCLMMLPNGTMADVKCEEVFPFICYRQRTKKEFTTKCGTIDNQYSLDSRTGSCYKFHSVGRTWSNAFMTCYSEGGYLAIINSEIEASVLKDLFARYRPREIFSQYKDIALLGFIDWNKNREWFTINGDTLQEAGYSKWELNQPNNLIKNGIGQYCGSMSRNSMFDDIWCNEIIAFICEKNPDSLRQYEHKE